VYRSTDKGQFFVRVSGNGTSGLPDAGVASLVTDPKNARRFYAGVPSRFGENANAGIYRSDDGGVTWAAVNTGLTGHTNSFRILLSVHHSRSANVVYAAIISDSTFTVTGVFRSTDQGGSWTAMGVPTPDIFPGAQGDIHGTILAHPADPNVVFIAGDRHNGPVPNVNGCRNFNANIFRGDAGQLPGNPWQSVVCDGARVPRRTRTLGPWPSMPRVISCMPTMVASISCSIRTTRRVCAAGSPLTVTSAPSNSIPWRTTL